MWHNLETVAKNRGLHLDKFMTFALANEQKYKISGLQVNTWNVDQLVSDFKQSILTVVLVDPIPMLLFCPKCKEQHIDKPEPEKGWANPPHKSHLCHFCGCIWRPADVETTGATIYEILTTGEKDTWPEPKSE